MKLDLFLIDLFQTGQVTVSRELTDMDEESKDRTLTLLAEYHRTDSLHMPFTAPAFHPAVACWSATYIYRSIQLVLLRDIDALHIDQLLVDCDGSDTAEGIYSADLMLRFLPDIFKLASGLSPEDPLVYRLKDIAEKWPFSSVGLEGVPVGNLKAIFSHPSLKQAYIDRVIAKEAINRIGGHNERDLLKEVLGMHRHKLWPNLNLTLNEEKI